MNFELVYPMAAMVLLTFVVLIAMFRSRVRAVKAGEASTGYYKTYQEGGEPRETAQLSRQLANLFESPTLYYAACIAGMVIGSNSTVLVALAWAYVALRIVHALIHTGRNKLQPRIRAYFTSWLVILAMWGTIVVGVATA
jgi:hypothetical protein